MVADSEDIGLHADRVYAGLSAMAEAERAQARTGIADLVRFLADPHGTLSHAAQRALFSDAGLRADFRRLKTTMQMTELPALAAASDGRVEARRFDGGTLRLHPSRVAGQVYLILQFNWPSSTPRAIILEGTAGEIVKRALPAADADGRALLILNPQVAADAEFLRLVGDPNSTGTFLI